MATVALGSLPFVEELLGSTALTLAKARGATRNEPTFGELGGHVARIDAALRVLGERPVPKAALEARTLLHQVRYAVREAHDLCHQYEDPLSATTVVFPEVYNEQLRAAIAALRILGHALEAALGTDQPPTLLKVDKLQEQVAKAQGSNYSLLYVPQAAVKCLPKELSSAVTGGCSEYLRAAIWGQWLRLEGLLREDAGHVNDQDAAFTLLHIAVLYQNPSAVAMLLGYGADIHARTQRPHLVPTGSTPLHIAAFVGYAPVVRLLVVWGANPAATDGRGTKAVNVATNPTCYAIMTNVPFLTRRVQEAYTFAFHGRFGQLQKALAKTDFPLNVKSSPDGRFFLIHQVAYNDGPAAYELMVEAGASALLRSSDLLLPSQIAALHQHPELAAVMEAQEQRERDLRPDPVERPLEPERWGSPGSPKGSRLRGVSPPFMRPRALEDGRPSPFHSPIRSALDHVRTKLAMSPGSPASPGRRRMPPSSSLPPF